MNGEITNLSILVVWLGVIIEVSVLGWLVFRIISYRSNIMQLIEQKGNEIYILLISLFVVMGCYYIFLGSINDDEGYYLYQGKLVYSGKLPYVDFYYSQAPLTLYIYGLPQIIFGPSMYTGRATALFFGLLTLIFTGKLAERFGGRVGGIIALGLISFNPYTIYYYTVVKAEVLTAFFMVLSLYFLFRNTRLKNPTKSMISISTMWLSVASKLSAFPAIILLMLYILYSKRKDRRTVLLSVGTGISVGAVLFVPFLIMAGDSMLYAMIGFYLGQGSPSGGTMEFGLPSIWQNIVGASFSNVYQNKIPIFLGIVHIYLPVLVMMSIGAIPLLERIRHRKDCDGKLYFLYILVASVFAFHFFKTEVFIHHQGVVLPVAAVLAGYGIAEMYANLKDNSKHILLTTASFLILAGLLTQTYGVGANADFSGDRTPIEKVEEMANYIKNNTPADGKLLVGRATYTAVQADRQVLPGFDTIWGGYRPGWSDELVEKYHVYNKNLLHNNIKNGNASAIVVTDFDRFHIIQGDGQRLIDERYYLAKTVQFYGQGGENAYLYLPKDAFISIQQFQVKQGDSQTWSGRVRPDADYVVTLRWPGNAVVVGGGKADTTGQVGGSFLVGNNIPSGPVTLQLVSDQSLYEEKTFFVGELSGSVSLVVVESHINYGAAQIWAASGLPPYASYILTLKLDGATLVLSGGNADENGDASGSFGVGTNIPEGENFLQIDVPSYPSYSAQTSFIVG